MIKIVNTSLKIAFLVVVLEIILIGNCFSADKGNNSDDDVFLTLKLKNVNLRVVFKEIEAQTEYMFFYKKDLNGLEKEITLITEKQPVKTVLKEVSKQTGLSFMFIGTTITVKNKKIPSHKLQKFGNEPDGKGTLKGEVHDEDGLPLIGATVHISALNLGTVADVNGNFQMLGVPAGIYTVTISFIGYKKESKEIEIQKGDVTLLNVQLQTTSLELGEVVAYGQAKGQAAAIKQQLDADGISNVVSAERLQELPDINVAEAIGRLPGMMVERNRGEGQKIIIRGLSPKYNTISIGGNIVPSTSTDDRSTDLNMISPDILGGVEVQKANTADKDADGLGGTVNLTLKEAPSGLKINGSVNTGYSGHSNLISNYRLNFYLSNRFFSDKLGFMVTGNADIAERNSDRFRVSYDVQGTPNYDAGETYIKPWITNASMEANLEDRSRAGGSVLLDWKISPSSTIKSSNFIGYLNREIYDRTKQYEVTSNYINLTQYQNKINQIVLSNAIEGNHVVFGSVLDWGVSRAKSVNNKPVGHRFGFRTLSVFKGYSKGQSFDIEPPELLPQPKNVTDQIDRYFFQNGRFQTYESEEIESSADINLKVPFRLNQQVSGFFKAGAKYRMKNRTRSNEYYTRRLDNTDGVNEFLSKYPEYILTEEGVSDKISVLNFVDDSYKPGDFMYDQFQYLKVDEVLDRNLMVDIYEDFLEDYYYYIDAGAQDDYDTQEGITSYYLMSELNFGEYVTFLPGIRYEKTRIKYMAFIAESIPESKSAEYDVDYQDTTARNTYSYLFPQIHFKFNPTSWFDVRLAYTKTLSRPDYNQLAPKKIISVASNRIELGNTELKPAISTNYDLILSFYKPKIGFLTLGGFFKDIEGFLWTREALVVSGTRTDPDVINVPRSTLGYDVIYPLNNTERSTIKGIELDIQSNLNFLPVKGFILNMNFTAMESETRYLETLIKRQLNPDYGTVPGAPRVVFVNQDTAYVDRLLSQPSYLANIGVGYDNQDIGLSLRLSFNFQDDILNREQRRPDGADREGTLEFYRWDFQFNKQITKRLSLNGNIANIFNRPDQSVRLLTGYIRNLEYYGYRVQIGLKYIL